MEKKILPTKPRRRAKPSTLTRKNQDVLQPTAKERIVKSAGKRTPLKTNDIELDRMIYALYELTENEIEILESK